jgi:hypothetical protein
LNGRFTASIYAAFTAPLSTEFMNIIVWCNCLDIYAGISDPSWQLELKAFPWLDEPITRQILKETFTDYASTLSSTPVAPQEFLGRLLAILKGLTLGIWIQTRSKTTQKIPPQLLMSLVWGGDEMNKYDERSRI